MKEHTPPIRASHVNQGTSAPQADLAWPSTPGRVFRQPKLLVSAERGESTAYGGLSLAAALVRRLGISKSLDQHLHLLRAHRPFFESDHVLTHVYNLFVGGSCIEDIGTLQSSEPVRRMLGAVRIPDPTTAGDFLRRFGEADLKAFNAAIDASQEQVWKRRYGKKKAERAIVDLDSHVHPVYGDQKEGADFSYKGPLAYHPLVISLAGSHECLRLINRSGNTESADGAETHLSELFPLLLRRFKQVVVRGDSAFCNQKIFDACHEAGQFFAMVSSSWKNLPGLFEALPDSAWEPYRGPETRKVPVRGPRRRRGRNRRREHAHRRHKRDLQLECQWIAEVAYRPSRSKQTYRLVARYQKIQERDEQGELFELYRFRFALSNLPDSVSAHEVMDLTYQRCDQENLIEQLQHGVAGMRMPTGGLHSNAAFLTCARLAHNLKSWLAQLALPEEVMRWEWKRFRQAYVYVAARVVHRARQVHVGLAGTHRHTGTFLAAHARLEI